jgi:Flp pilus assembly protein TadG
MTSQARILAAHLLGRLLKNTEARRFVSNEKGSTMVEFAMISVPFLGLIGAIFEAGMVFFNSAQLQTVTELASRSILTHSASAGMTYGQFIDNNVCTWQAQGVVVKGTLSKAFDCSKVIVDISSPTGWSVANVGNGIYVNPAPRSSVISLPAPGQIAVVRIAYPMTPAAAILTGGAFSGMTITRNTKGQTMYNGQLTDMLLGVVAFRVEP